MQVSNVTVELPGTIAEGTSSIFAVPLLKSDGSSIDLASVTALAVTLKDVASATVVNGRSAQDCLGINGGAIDLSGQFSLALSVADVAAIGPAKFQQRRLTLHVVFVGGEANRDYLFWIQNLADVA